MSPTERKHIEIYRDGACVSRSRNLRGLIAYGHRYGVRLVIVEQKTHDVYVYFEDGATCVTRFADNSVAADFFNKRVPRWGGSVRVV